MKRQKTIIVIMVMALTVLTACGAKSSSSAPMETTAGYQAAEAAAVMDANGQQEYEYETQAAAALEGAPGELADTALLTTPAPQGRKLIRSINMDVETDKFQDIINQITGKTSELGGYIEQSNISGGGLSHDNASVPKYATMTLRIPSDRMDTLLKEVETAASIVSRSENASDVTLQYSNIESRKKTLQIEQERIWALLEKAESLETVLSLEQRLTEIRYELESYESQLRTYDNQVDYGTITLTIAEVKEFTPVAPEPSGKVIQKRFMHNLKLVTGGISGFLIWLFTSSPILIFLAFLGVIVYLIVRLIIKKGNNTVPVRNDEKIEKNKE